MKIQFTDKRVKLVRVVIALIAVSLAGYVVYASTQISVSNTVNITPQNNIGVSITATNPGTCPAFNDPSYKTVAFSNPNAWTFPSSTASSSSQFFCLENNGTGNDATPSITLGTTTITGLTVGTTPTTIPAINAGSVSAPVTVTVSIPSTPTGSGTFSLTVG